MSNINEEIRPRADLLKEGLIPEQGGKDPFRVVQSTGRNLELRIRGEIDPKPIDSYFTDVTLPHLDTVTEAARAYYDPFRPKVHNRSLAINLSSDITTDEISARAAVDLYSVIFSHIPDLFTNPFIPTGYSRQLEMHPPSTQREMVQRIQELGVVLRGFMSGQFGLKDLNLQRHTTPVVRTLAFYRVGASLPVHNPLSTSEREEALEISLVGIDFDLPESPIHKESQRLHDQVDAERKTVKRLLEGIEIEL